MLISRGANHLFVHTRARTYTRLLLFFQHDKCVEKHGNSCFGGDSHVFNLRGSKGPGIREKPVRGSCQVSIVVHLVLFCSALLLCRSRCVLMTLSALNPRGANHVHVRMHTHIQQLHFLQHQSEHAVSGKHAPNFEPLTPLCYAHFLLGVCMSNLNLYFVPACAPATSFSLTFCINAV